MAEFLTANAPWSQLIQDKNIELREVDEATSFSPIDGLHVQAIPVPHRDDWSDTVAFKISGSSQTVLFVPDIDQWDGNEQLLEQLLDGVDVAYIDATFYDGKEFARKRFVNHSAPLHG